MKETIRPNYYLVLICPSQRTKSKQIFVIVSGLEITPSQCLVVYRDLDLRNHVFFRPEPWDLRNVRCETFSASWLSSAQVLSTLLPIPAGGEDVPLSHPTVDLRGSAPHSRWVIAALGTWLRRACPPPQHEASGTILWMAPLPEVTPIRARWLCRQTGSVTGNAGATEEGMENEHRRVDREFCSNNLTFD